MKLLLILTLLSFTSTSYAGPHKEGLVSSASLGTRFSSIMQRRGVIFYKNYQFDPVVTVFFLDDKLEFLGDSIDYRDFIFEDKIRLRTRLVAISDNPIFPSDQNIEDSSPHRKDTKEWTNAIEFFLPGYNENYKSEIDVSFSKDLSVHYGHYLEFLGKIKLKSFEIKNLEIEINAFSSLGWGDSSHNGYFYGADVQKGGFNNWSKGFWVTLPNNADRYFSIIQLSHFQVLGPYQDGIFAKNRNDGFLFSLIITFGVL